MPDDVLLNKAGITERYLQRIEEEYRGHEDELENNLTRQDSIILNLQRACEAAIDGATHIVRVRRLGLPQESREAFVEVVTQLDSVVRKIDQGEGTLGRLVNDPLLYDQIQEASANLKNILARLDAGRLVELIAAERVTVVTIIGDAVGRSLPLLQRTATSFYEKSGCVSCHNNSLTAMTVSAARRQGFAVDERGARHELATVVEDVTATREQALQGIVSPGGMTTTLGYILMGLSAEGHRADAGTDAIVRLITGAQLPDGRWRTPFRPPTEASEFTATAVSLRRSASVMRPAYPRAPGPANLRAR